MACIAELIRPKDNKTLKVEHLSGTYKECEETIKKRNDESKRKDESFWKITIITR